MLLDKCAVLLYGLPSVSGLYHRFRAHGPTPIIMSLLPVCVANLLCYVIRPQRSCASVVVVAIAMFISEHLSWSGNKSGILPAPRTTAAATTVCSPATSAATTATAAAATADLCSDPHFPSATTSGLWPDAGFFFFPNFVNGFEFLLLSVFARMIRCYICHLFLLLLLVSKSRRVVVFCCCHLL